MTRRTFLRGMALGALAGPLTAEAQHAGKVAEGDGQQVPTLRRGLNLSHWFAQARSALGYSPEYLTAHTTASDAGLIPRLGFYHARVSVDPGLLFTPANVELVQPDRLQQLDRAVRMITDADLAVVIDMHPTSDFKQALARDDGQVDRFADFWRDFAGRVAGLPSERVAFEILKEAEFEDRYRWSGVQAKLSQASDSRHHGTRRSSVGIGGQASRNCSVSSRSTTPMSSTTSTSTCLTYSRIRAPLGAGRSGATSLLSRIPLMRTTSHRWRMCCPITCPSCS